MRTRSSSKAENNACKSSTNHHRNNVKFEKQFRHGVRRYRRGKSPKYTIGLEKDWGTGIAAYNSGYGAVKGGKNHQKNNRDYWSAFRRGVRHYHEGRMSQHTFGDKGDRFSSVAAYCSGYGSAMGSCETIRVDPVNGTVDGVEMCSEKQAEVVRLISRQTGKVPEVKKKTTKPKLFALRRVKGWIYF
jgi:hypothetical protein